MNQILALYEAGRLQEADAAARQVLQHDPKNTSAMNILGVIAHDVGRSDLAVQWYERAIQIDPSQAMLFINLGEAHRVLGNGNAAIAAYRMAIERDPNDPLPRNDLAIVLANLGQLDQAMQIWRELVALRPDFAVVMNNLGNVLLEQGELAEAAYWHRRGAEADPASASTHSNLLRDLQHMPDVSPEQLLEEHQRWWQRHGEKPAAVVRPHPNNRDPEKILRVGWVSADFREHSVAMFLEPIFEHHDRTRMEFTAYSDVPTEDEVTARLKRLVARWRSIRGQRDEQVEQQIRTDEIDILINLAGHTGGNRATLFARKPAPVQISYLGYPATTGIPTIGYRITDALADPPGMTEAHHTEKLVRLPKTAWCYRPPSDAPEISPLPAMQNGFVTFGSFNSFSKVNRTVIQAWAAILNRVDGSKIFLRANGLSDASVQAKVRLRFTEQGISPQRILMMGRVPVIADHLAYYSQIDIALDTFPYHGTTTTCEALWMGVPVVTIAGSEHRSRVGVSLLSNVGLENLVMDNLDAYIAKAVQMAGELDALSVLRSGLRDRMQKSVLRDESGFAGKFEKCLRQIWREWCEQ
jgi:protein O-GlcNAc transferase